jgi:diguanylate cyclase (GGDEF)-like protein/PAS domain S-box-containing protein
MAPGRYATRAVGMLLLAGSLFVVVSLALPHPSGADEVALAAIAAAMALVGAFCFERCDRLPVPIAHGVLAATAVATCLLIWFSGIAVGQYGTIFVWGTLVAAYYFTPHVAAAHVAWILVAYGVTLAATADTAGYSPLTRWLFSAISLSVVALITTALVARRRRSDARARRFFDLSHDMLCTFDSRGRALEVNSAWEGSLGYSAEELYGESLLRLVHPEERERTVAASRALFEEGREDVDFENRYRAKDGSWHWLRWSASLARDESLIYGRATDITRLKRVEAEREALLEEVEELARSDALTGLPNRRALDETLPREMVRARRSGASLCLAILDFDHFKAYNDSHGHLVGDILLRDCASAWDAELRGEDLLVRFGGEEFLVVMPDCEPGDAVEIVERLRASMPDGQTCSAGLVRWDGVEATEELLARADVALYDAKGGGRDRLVLAA